MKIGETVRFQWIEKDSPLPSGWSEVKSRWVHHHFWSRLIRQDSASKKKRKNSASKKWRAA